MLERAIRFPFCRLIIQAPDEKFLALNVLRDNVYVMHTDATFYLKINQKMPSSDSIRYREKMFGQGLYLGHHLGPPAKLYVGEDELYIQFEDRSAASCNRIIWSFVVKYVLSMTSLRSNALHLKGVLLLREKRALLLLGRGNAGKTTLSKFLSNNGYQIIANTHCVTRTGYVWGVNTWVRRRVEEGVDQYEFFAPPRHQEGTLNKIIIYEYNDRGEFHLRPLTREFATAFITYFAAGIGNYDLKEDIFEGTQGYFEDRCRLLSTELALVDELVNRHKIDYLSCDLTDLRAAAALLRTLT